MKSAEIGLTKTTKLDPFMPELDAIARALCYDRWFWVKIKEALNDPRPTIPHEEAMKLVNDLINQKRRERLPN